MALRLVPLRVKVPQKSAGRVLHMVDVQRQGIIATDTLYRLPVRLGEGEIVVIIKVQRQILRGETHKVQPRPDKSDPPSSTSTKSEAETDPAARAGSPTDSRA